MHISEYSDMDFSKLAAVINDAASDAQTIWDHEDRLIDNSCCTSAERRAENDKKLEGRMEAIANIKAIFEI